MVLGLKWSLVPKFIAVDKFLGPAKTSPRTGECCHIKKRSVNRPYVGSAEEGKRGKVFFEAFAFCVLFSNKEQLLTHDIMVENI